MNIIHVMYVNKFERRVPDYPDNMACKSLYTAVSPDANNHGGFRKRFKSARRG
jgi:hypothetical protein